GRANHDEAGNRVRASLETLAAGSPDSSEHPRRLFPLPKRGRRGRRAAAVTAGAFGAWALAERCRHLTTENRLKSDDAEGLKSRKRRERLGRTADILVRSNAR